MNYSLLLAGALCFSAGAVQAQTVLPSGAVAPSSGTLTPGTVPGAQTVTTPDMRNAGSPRASRHDEKVPGMSHRDEKRLRKMSKVKTGPDGIIKTPAH